MKNIFKFISLVGGLILIFAGLSNIFLVKGGDHTGWGMFFITLGGIAIWYWRKK